ncbi:MAG: M23 family metallopeptidase [Aggregatilineales bacterium]
MTKKRMALILGAIILISGAIGGFTYLQLARSNSGAPIGEWFRTREGRSALITENTAPCANAPFLLPSTGFIGLLWRDPIGPYNILRRHSGVDIFGNGAPGEVPIVAVYDGYLTRLDEWLSTVIIRHDDPLQPGRTIWTYYTHMANRDGTESFIDEAFPRGTSEQFVEQGTLLGYQGEYAGNAPPVGLHVHLSIVLSEEDGSFKNEAILSNTLDPSPYFGLPLNIADLPDRPIQCGDVESES